MPRNVILFNKTASVYIYKKENEDSSNLERAGEHKMLDNLIFNETIEYLFLQKRARVMANKRKCTVIKKGPSLPFPRFRIKYE